MSPIRSSVPAFTLRPREHPRRRQAPLEPADSLALVRAPETPPWHLLDRPRASTMLALGRLCQRHARTAFCPVREDVAFDPKVTSREASAGHGPVPHPPKSGAMDKFELLEVITELGSEAKAAKAAGCSAAHISQTMKKATGLTPELANKLRGACASLRSTRPAQAPSQRASA